MVFFPFTRKHALTSFFIDYRIENIESAEIRGNFGTSQRKQITLVDGDGVALNFFLWSEQVLLANLFRVGCMLALDKPYVASSAECGIQTNEEFCLEYGSATQLYLVPYIQHEEQLEELLMSIGRAILKDPKILLLDEATSALDAECACIDTNLCICMFFLNLGDFLVQKLGEGVKGVYISIDVDCLDPAFAPGVSHIEPGGLSFRDVVKGLYNHLSIIFCCRVYSDSAKIVARTLTRLGFKNSWTIGDGFSGGKGWLQSRLGTDSYKFSFAEVLSPSRIIPAGVKSFGTTSRQSSQKLLPGAD
ncbi:hypothetical protein RYX36_030854 [Vicia faba]